MRYQHCYLCQHHCLEMSEFDNSTHSFFIPVTAQTDNDLHACVQQFIRERLLNLEKLENIFDEAYEELMRLTRGAPAMGDVEETPMQLILILPSHYSFFVV